MKGEEVMARRKKMESYFEEGNGKMVEKIPVDMGDDGIVYMTKEDITDINLAAGAITEQMEIEEHWANSGE